MKKIFLFLLAFFSIVQANTFHVTSWGVKGLVGAWHLDEGRGLFLNNSSEYPYSGALGGGVAWVTGRDKYALNFDGSDDFVDLSSGSQFSPANNPVTYIVSIRMPAADGTGRIAFVRVQNSEFEFRYNSDDTNGFQSITIFQADAGASTALSGVYRTDDRTWHRIAFSMQQSASGAAQIRLWHDGRLDGQTTQGAFNMTDNGRRLQMGGNPTNSGGGYNMFTEGDMEEPVMYARFLTPAEIMFDYVRFLGRTNN